MLKAIYNRDVLEADVPVFEFNPETGDFEYGEEVEGVPELFYHFAIVMNDPDWQVYATDGELVYPIENLNRVPEDEISSLLPEVSKAGA